MGEQTQTKLILPGAEQFLDYFAEHMKDSGFTSLDVVFVRRVRQWGHWGRVYQIRFNHNSDTVLGEYTRYNPAKGKQDGIRTFEGRLPWYTNQAIVEANRNRDDGKHDDERIVRLCYCEALMTDGNPRNYWGPVSQDGFARIDGHRTIPFP